MNNRDKLVNNRHRSLLLWSLLFVKKKNTDTDKNLLVKVKICFYKLQVKSAASLKILKARSRNIRAFLEVFEASE